MTLRNGIALALIIISLLLLYPGLTQPVMNVYVGTEVPLLGKIEFFNETQNIVESIKSLFESNNNLVAWLILLFSIIVPVLKAVLLLAVIIASKLPARLSVLRFVALISKWSMADVFVVSIFMAFLATKSNPYIEATLHPGFYYFLGYCIVSMVAVQCIRLEGQLDHYDKALLHFNQRS